ASRAVTSIEINGSFYSLQTPERFASWRDATPDDFVFSVKAPRYITHVRRLRDIDEAMANFFASGPLQLEHKLGAFLCQFPPSILYYPELFGTFLALLPSCFSEPMHHSRQGPHFDDQPIPASPAVTP